MRAIAALMIMFLVGIGSFAQSGRGVQDPQNPSETDALVNPPAEQKGALKVARVYFVSPKDGATVPREFTAKFAVEGMKVAKAGVIEPGTGHFHVLIDSPIVAEGVIVPADKKHLHFGEGQTEAKLKLTPGQHTLVLQFADGAHRAFTKLLSHEIKVTVK